jgi:hypothetical protein
VGIRLHRAILFWIVQWPDVGYVLMTQPTAAKLTGA